jgi:NADPH:quinone reductase-like Zn-dependent oxidoreductase
MLKIEHRPIPQPLPGEVLIRIEPFGLNRSELFTRRGHSPNVVLPRVLGTVAAAPTAIFAKAHGCDRGGRDGTRV